MKKSTKDLLELQAMDMRVRALKTRYNTIPVERDRIIAEFEVIKKAFEAEKQKLLQIRQEIKQCEAQASSLEEKHQAMLVKSATIKKPAEFEAAMAEIANIKMKISDAETKQLQLMDQAEAQEKVVTVAEAKYKSHGRVAKQEVLELDELKKQIVAEAKEKMQISQLNEKRVGQAYLAQYKRILATGKGEPLSKIIDGHCGNCMISIPPMTLNKAKIGDIITCDSCSYMLYDPNAKELD